MSTDLSSEEITKLAAGIMKGTCKLVHNHSCTYFYLQTFIHTLKFGLKFYLPLHIISLILKYKQLVKNPSEAIQKSFKACVRSMMLLSSMILIGRVTLCTWIRITGNANEKMMRLIAASVTLGTFVESSAKISEMAMYLMPRFFDAFWKFLKRRGYCVSVPYGQVIIFCLSISGIIYNSRFDPDSVRPIYRKACGKFFGIN